MGERCESRDRLYWRLEGLFCLYRKSWICTLISWSWKDTRFCGLHGTGLFYGWKMHHAPACSFTWKRTYFSNWCWRSSCYFSCLCPLHESTWERASLCSKVFDLAKLHCWIQQHLLVMPYWKNLMLSYIFFIELKTAALVPFYWSCLQL